MSQKLLAPSPLSRIRAGNVRRRVPFLRRRWVAIVSIFFVLAGLLGLAIVVAIVKPLREMAESLPLENLRKIERASHIHDRKGDELGRIYVMNRTPIKIEQVPMHFIHALTSEEDARFYEHSGVDWFGVCRAFYINFKVGGETQGASTITQQLARDAFKLKELEEEGDKHSRYKRKIVEAFLAERIEKQFSKSDILEMYLNRVYFGGGAYGVQAAAQVFFGKDVSQVSIDESASLCCMLKNPAGLNPRTHLNEHTRWRNHVMDRMLEERFLSPQELQEYKSRKVVLAQKPPDPRLSYVYDEIRQEAMKIIGEEGAQAGGFNIYTTIDRQLQKSAEESMHRRLAEVEAQPGYPNTTYAQYHVALDEYRKRLSAKQTAPEELRPQAEYLQGAVLAIDNHDGGILALVGGRDFLDSMYNRALQSRRPAGTAFVPFVYAAAFQKPEFFPAMQLENGPIANKRIMIGGMEGILGEWGTEEDAPKYSSAHISARDALAQGQNAAAVRMGEQVGLESIKELAARAGIASPLRDYPSTYLGASEVKLDELCLAYSTFPNKGRRPKALSLIRRITDADGKVIFQVNDDVEDMVVAMDEIAAYQTHSCLVDALTRGTGKVAYEDYGLEQFPAAGKTGTHSDFKDLWFLGYTSAVTCGVWCGFDQQKTIYPGAFSKRLALPIWVDVMNAARKTYPPEDITPPSQAEPVEVCRKSGLRATDGCYEKIPDPVHGGMKSVRDTYMEVMRHRSYFDVFCNIHGGVPMSPLPSPKDEVPESSPVASTSTEPVRMKGLTVIGADPFDSLVPLLKAVPVNSDGTRVKKAIPVSEDTSIKPTESPLRLPPPPPLKID